MNILDQLGNFGVLRDC